MRYHDFVVRVASERRGRYRKEVLESPCGAASDPFLLPFEPRLLAKLPGAFERRVRGKAERPARPGSSAAVPLPSAEEIGNALFRSLFSGAVGERFRQSLAYVEGRPSDEGLRLRLTFDPDDPALGPLSALPWELLYDDLRGDFLSRLRQTSISRFLPVPRNPPPPASGARSLRVLVASSSPKDLDSLDLAQEQAKIAAALAGKTGIEVEPLEHTTLAGLRSKLLAGPWHVLHLMGHGYFDPRTGEGGFAFEDEDGRARWATGTLLGDHLKGMRELLLVVLNACSTAVVSRRRGQDPYSGVAPALLRAGVPAVLAMQFPISDGAAIAFSSQLYGRLAAHDPLEAAVAEARLAILRRNALSPEWPIPLLLTRVKDGDLLAFSNEPPAGAPPAPPPARPREPLRLGIRSFSDAGGTTLWGQEMKSECADVLDLRDSFGGPGGRQIGNPSWWQEKIFPELRRFLARAAAERGPVHLNLAAHASLAFASGYCLDVKSGLDVTIRQRGQRGVEEWRTDSPGAPAGPLFEEEPSLSRDPAARDVALALGITRPVADDVVVYLEDAGLPVHRILPLTPTGGPGFQAVRDGFHALELAQAIAWQIRGRTLDERRGVLHLFAAAPNALLFFLGQLARGLGRIQLYEYDFESGLPGAYRPSLLLPPLVVDGE
jgi:hypothetical protein